MADGCISLDCKFAMHFWEKNMNCIKKTWLSFAKAFSFAKEVLEFDASFFIASFDIK